MAESRGTFNPELKINLTAIKKCDKFVVNILDNASQVALYKFKSNTQAWEKTEVEGALFVYSRSTRPRTSFFIMNRLKMENLTEPITADMEFKLQEPFLLYRNKARDIFGIWFYDGDECMRLGKLMISLSTTVEELKPSVGKQKTTKERCPSNGKVDLLQLFATAQEKYEKSNGKTQKEHVPAEEMKPSQVKQQEQVDDQPQAVPVQDLVSSKPRAQTFPAQYQMSPTNQHRVLSAEKSNPGQTQPMLVASVQEPGNLGQNVTLASIRVPFITENQPPVDSTKPLAQRKLFQSNNSTLSAPSQESPQKQLDSGSGTSLMSPLTFQPSTRTSTSTAGGTSSAVTKPSVSPLQMEQFVQAFSYLVKNDDDFMQRLHEAYVKTLQRS